MIRSRFLLSITINGPLLSHGVGSIAFGTDSIMLHYKNQPVLNGSLIRGNIRHVFEYFAEQLIAQKKTEGNILKTDIIQWFGKKNSELNDANDRAHLNFDFFWKPTEDLSPKNRTRTRIKISDETGVVIPGNMNVIEDICMAGEKISFSGFINAFFTSPDEEDRFQYWVEKALKYLPALGALKGVGYGRIDNELSTLKKRKKATQAAESENNYSAVPDHELKNIERLGLTLNFDRPICITKPRTKDSNAFISSEIIPGNVIKGALADTLNKLEEIDWQNRICFDNLGITHAMPANQKNLLRSHPIPLSVCKFNNNWHDMALEKDPIALQLPTEQGDEIFAPFFKPDWKEGDLEKAANALGIAESCSPPHVLRIHTAINAEKGVSEKNQLFSIESVDTSEHTWCADIMLNEIPADKRPGVIRCLAGYLDNGISNIGKTKSIADVRLKSQTFLPTNALTFSESKNDIIFIATLSTAARMLPTNLTAQGTNGDKVLHDSYDNYWKFISNNTLSLSHFFAQQELNGGDFYWHRYIKSKSKDNHEYAPEWLTTPGSVFVLKTTEQNQEQATKYLRDWVKYGLPPAEDRIFDDWQTDPYLSKHGFGEISVKCKQQLVLANYPQESRVVL